MEDNFFSEETKIKEREIRLLHQKRPPVEQTPAYIFNPVSAFDIVTTNYPPLDFIVEGLLPQGLALLCAPPKYGKSWLALDLCLSVSWGMDFLGKKTKQSDVLYIALEDSERRLKERIKKIWGNNPFLGRFLISTRAKTLDTGLIIQLETYLQNNPKIKLIVIDTLQKIRGPASRGEQAYAYDYRELTALKNFADKHNICLLLIHHLRKMKDDTDAFAQISGTNGVSGTADTNIVLSRNNRTDKETVLSAIGRDIEYTELLMSFNTEKCVWEVIGNVQEVTEHKKLEGYRENPIVRTVKTLLEENSGTWEGTASELQDACIKRTNCCVPPANILSREIKKVQKVLYEIDGIIYKAPNPNGGVNGRKHIFQYRK